MVKPDIIVNADLFRIVNTVSSDEEVRYYLNGVFVEPRPQGGVILVATDGHRLLAAFDSAGRAKSSAIVRLDADALKACKSGLYERRSVEVTGSEATVLRQRLKGGAAEGKPQVVGAASDVLIDGTYPDWRRVIPIVKNSVSPAFSTKYLLDMASAGLGFLAADAAMRGERGPKAASLRLQANDDSAPALVRWERVDHAFGVLMPVADLTSIGLPGFMGDLSRSKAA